MRVLASGMEWFSENPGGLPRYFADYLEAWTRSGQRAKAYVRTVKRLNANQHPGYVSTLDIESGNPLLVRQVWRRTFRDELRSNRYDVFNPHFAYYAWGFPTIDSDIPVVTHFHGPWAYETLLENVEGTRWKKSVQFRMQHWIEERVYRRSDRFIVLSQYFRDQLIQRYGIPMNRIHVIPGAVDVERFCDSLDRDMVRKALNIPEERFVLLTVRRLVRRMGLDNLIRAVDKLRLSFPSIMLVMVGGGPLYKELQQLVKQLNLEDYVRLTNRVPDDVLPMYYQAADLTVVPTLALEGFGFVTVESMACGTPVVGTPVGGTKEILCKIDGKLLFGGSTVEDLVDGLGRLLQHPHGIPSRSKIRAHALQNYTWDVVIPQIRQVFEMAGAAR